MMSEKVLSERQLADELGVSPWIVRGWRLKKIPATLSHSREDILSVVVGRAVDDGAGVRKYQ